jgi:hypothetical protein
MAYFSGSLLNPERPNQQDNRNKTPFDQYFPDVFPTSSPGVGMSMPRNEAFRLPPILNPSASYRAFAQPKENSPFLGLLKDARNFTKGRSTERTPDPQPRFGVPYIGNTPLFRFLNSPNRSPSRDLGFNPFRIRKGQLFRNFFGLENPIPPMFMRR